MSQSNLSVDQMYGQNYKHFTDREDWSLMINSLFYKVINPWPTNGLAVATNVYNDIPYPDKPFMRIRDGLEPVLRRSLRYFGRHHFDEIFESAQHIEPDISDCYKIRNLGLLNNSYAHLVEQTDKVRRAMLIFKGPWFEGDLEKRVGMVVDEILKIESSEVFELGLPQDYDPLLASKSIPNLRLASRASIPHLVSREYFLESMGEKNLSGPETWELGSIRKELFSRVSKPH